MNDAKNLVAEYIRENKNQIIAEWERRVREELLAAQQNSHFTLMNELPLFVDKMVQSLEHVRTKVNEAVEIAESHALQRYELPEYSLEQVLAEYRIMLQVVFDKLSQENIPVTDKERNVIINLIHTGKAAAARTYSEQALDKQREISRALQEAEEFKRRMLESSEDCFKVLDLDGLLIDITERSLEHLELESAQSILGTPWIDLWKRSEDRKAGLHAMAEAKKGRIGTLVGYYKTKSGNREWWDVTVSPINDENGRPEKILVVSRDVTQQIKAKEQLELSETRFRQMFEQAGIGKVLTDPSTKKILQANESFCRLVGYTEKELQQMTFEDITYSEDRLISKSKYEEFSKRNHSHWSLEKRYVCKGGEIVWVSLHATALRDPTGKVVVLSTIIDISDRKKIEAEKEMLLERERAARFKSENATAAIKMFIMAAPIPAAQLDLEFRFVRINEALATLNGKSVDDHIGKTIFEMAPAFADIARKILAEVVTSKKPYHAPEYELIAPGDNKKHWLLSIYFPIQVKGHVTGVGFLSIDVTDQKQLQIARDRLLTRIESLQVITEVALSETTTLETLLTNSLEIIKDRISCDTTAILLLNESKQALDVRAAIGLEEEIERKIQIPVGKGIAGKILATGKSIRIDDLKDVDISSSVLREKNVKCLIGVPLKTKGRILGVLHVGRLELYPFSEDDLDLLELIADRLSIAIDNAQLYSELLQNIDSLEFERGMREQFVNTLSHDLRNPLTAAKMSAQIITRTSDLQRASDLAFRVMNSLNRADRMIQDLLDANRIRAGHPLPLELSDCDVVQLTSEVIDEFTSMHGRRFKLKAPGELKAFVSCNEIVRLLENLIGNAIKYGAEKEIEVSLEKLPENLFQICVHNWGNPISVEKQQRLFKPFSRTPEAEAGGKKGWGLGLTLVRGVAEAHGGKVKVESSKSEGTTFTVILPLNAQQ